MKKGICIFPEPYPGQKAVVFRTRVPQVAACTTSAHDILPISEATSATGPNAAIVESPSPPLGRGMRRRLAKAPEAAGDTERNSLKSRASRKAAPDANDEEFAPDADDEESILEKAESTRRPRPVKKHVKKRAQKRTIPQGHDDSGSEPLTDIDELEASVFRSRSSTFEGAEVENEKERVAVHTPAISGVDELPICSSPELYDASTSKQPNTIKAS